MPPRCSQSISITQSSKQRNLVNRCAPAQHDSCPTRSRKFQSSTRNDTRLRRDMWAWLNGPGKVFREPLAGSTNYLSAYDKTGNLERAKFSDENKQGRSRGAADAELDEDEAVIQRREEEKGLDPETIEQRAQDRAYKRMARDEAAKREGVPKERARDLRPYPLNDSFQSQPVLSEDLREEIYRQVTESGLDLNSVSVVYGVDVRRVAAVVRLKTIEKRWTDEGKPLAKPYNNAILEMLPQTPFRADVSRPRPHETINDLPVHPWTRQQIFFPTSESRHFTRKDAAKVFNDSLLPPDERIPNKQLIQIQKWENEGIDRDTRRKLIRDMDAKERQKRVQKEKEKAEWLEKTQIIVPGRRSDFKFTNFSVEAAGKDGRGRGAIGHRYGMPHEDRKRGKFKLPTSVE